MGAGGDRNKRQEGEVAQGGSNTVKSVQQQENINTFPFLTAVTGGGGTGGGAWTCQQLLTHVSRLPLGLLLGGSAPKIYDSQERSRSVLLITCPENARGRPLQ